MPIFRHDGVDFHYRDEGAGLPFVFQHGLGSDVSQPFELCQPSTMIRLMAFDCRGHGQTEPLGNLAEFSIPCFANDLRALLDYLQISAAVIGGTSMGAAIAINFALQNPDRTLGLVLSRPAWLDRKHPENLRVVGLVSRLLRIHVPGTARDVFLQTDEFAELLQESPASAASVLNLFSAPRPVEMAACLERIFSDRPCNDLRELRLIKVPVLILVNRLDPIHPHEYGTQLAEHISGSKIVEITPRTESTPRHIADVRRSIDEFFKSSGLGDR